MSYNMKMESFLDLQTYKPGMGQLQL